LTLEETPGSPPHGRLSESRASEEASPELTLADLHGREVVGSVPIWALAGLRVHRTGWRQMQAGWVVGVYLIDISSLEPLPSPDPE
jgi:hypothetical protein